MSEQLRCDNCGRTSEAPHGGGWLRAESVDAILTYASETKDRHFCSPKCVASFYVAKSIGVMTR